MMIEYRPCIVTETVYPPNRQQGIIKYKRHNALFHQWIKRTVKNLKVEPYMTGDFVFQQNDTNDEYLIGIVEYEDGTIHKHLPHEIQFTDGMAKKISKNKKDDWKKLMEDTYSYPEPYENKKRK